MLNQKKKEKKIEKQNKQDMNKALCCVVADWCNMEEFVGSMVRASLYVWGIYVKDVYILIYTNCIQCVIYTMRNNSYGYKETRFSKQKEEDP